MIDCEDVLREVSNYIDTEVGEDLRRQIEEHIRGCHNCRVLVNTTRKTVGLVSNSRVFELPASVSERLMQRLAKHYS